MRHALVSLAVVMLSGVAAADQFGCPTCRSCGGACVLQAKPVVEKETCYEVECKDVCIPAVRFPWDSCREPKCGRVRRIAVLKKESRETKSCKYEWVVVCPRCGKLHQNGDARKSVPPAPEPPQASTPPPTVRAATVRERYSALPRRSSLPNGRGSDSR